MPYVTPDDIKNFTNMEVIKDLATPQLLVVCEMVELRINSYCNQDFYSYPNETKRINGNDSSLLVLPKRLESLTQILIDEEEFDISLFEIDNNYLTSLSEDIVFNAGFKNITITGNWGFSEIPSKVKMAAKMIGEKYAFQKYGMTDEQKQYQMGPFYAETFGPYSYKKGRLNLEIDGDGGSTGDEEVDLLLAEFRIENVKEGVRTDNFFIFTV